MKSYNLESCHGSFLSVLNDGTLTHIKGAHESLNQLVQLIYDQDLGIGLLITKSNFLGNIRWSNSSWKGSALYVEVEKLKYEVTLKKALDNTFITPAKVFNEAGKGLVKTEKTIAKSYENFKFHESKYDVDDNYFDCLKNIHKICTLPVDRHKNLVAVILDKLLLRNQKKVILDNVLVLISNIEFSAFSHQVMNSKKILAELSEIYAEDPWLNQAIPKLIKWEKDKASFISKLMPFKQPNVLKIDRKYDFLAVSGQHFCSSSAGQLINSFLRQGVNFSKRTCVVATARNEGIYLIEWIAHYLTLGFNHFFIYSNDNSDSSDALLQSLSQNGFITWIDNDVGPKVRAQRKAYSHALSMMPDILDYEWTLIVDIDEFLSLNYSKFSDINEFIDWHEMMSDETDVICFNWRYPGSNQQVFWSDKPLKERFIYQVGKVNRHIKCMFKTSSVISSQPHFPRADERTSLTFVEADSQPHTWNKSELDKSIACALSDTPTESHAYLFHFFYRSAEEFLWKWSRNRGGQPRSESDISIALQPRFLTGFLKQFNVQDTCIQDQVNFNKETFNKNMEKMLAIQSINLAQLNVKNSFIERNRKVIELYKPELSHNFGDEGKAFLKLLNNNHQ